MEVVKTFQLKIAIFTAVNNRCMLHRHVIVMDSCIRLKWASTGFRLTGLLRYTGKLWVWNIVLKLQILFYHKLRFDSAKTHTSQRTVTSIYILIC